MGPYIRGAEAPSGGDPLLGCIIFFFNDPSQISNLNKYNDPCSDYYTELTAILEKNLNRRIGHLLVTATPPSSITLLASYILYILKAISLII